MAPQASPVTYHAPNLRRARRRAIALCARDGLALQTGHVFLRAGRRVHRLLVEGVRVNVTNHLKSLLCDTPYQGDRPHQPRGIESISRMNAMREASPITVARNTCN